MIILTKERIPVVVDDEDYEAVKNFRWHIHKDGEPVANIKIKGTTFKVKMKSLLKNVVRTGKDVYYLDGDPLNNSKENLSFSKCRFVIHGDYAEMVSSCAQYKVKVDIHMIGFLNECNWTFRDVGYVFTRIDNENVHLHRFLLGLGQYNVKDGTVVDHINGDTTDNRLQNLRVCTVGQNNTNSSKGALSLTSKFKGVSWCKKKRCWRVRVMHLGELKYYSEFTDEIAGANAYNYYASIYHGEFAGLNEVRYMSKATFEKFLYVRKAKSHTKYTGVTYHLHSKRWIATFIWDRKRYHVGSFLTEKEAVTAYNDFIVSERIDRKLNTWTGSTCE